MSRSIAWIDGQWLKNDDRSIPLNDRGLLLADGLFETVLIRDGLPLLLTEHLQRWSSSAALLEMDAPPDSRQLLPLIQNAVQRCDLFSGFGALRLNWSRGTAIERGIGLPPPGGHRFWLSLHPCQPGFTPAATIISRHERRNAHSRLSGCKTFAYGPSIQARREAEQQGADDALLLNTLGQLCCGTVANILVKRGEQWLTPPLSSGCLAGVMRGQAIQQGLASEADLGGTFQPGDQALLINSLGCRPVHSVDGIALTPPTNVETIWTSLLA